MSKDATHNTEAVREPSRDLTEDELSLVSGGSALSSAVSEVMKNFGGALQTAARG
jgi:hypothetical protein